MIFVAMLIVVLSISKDLSAVSINRRTICIKLLKYLHCSGRCFCVYSLLCFQCLCFLCFVFLVLYVCSVVVSLFLVFCVHVVFFCFVLCVSKSSVLCLCYSVSVFLVFCNLCF